MNETAKKDLAQTLQVIAETTSERGVKVALLDVVYDLRFSGVAEEDLGDAAGGQQAEVDVAPGRGGADRKRSA